MNIRKLRAQMVLEDVTVESLAKGIEMSSDALYRRFRSPETFTIKEADDISKFLHLTGAEATEIFFEE